MDFIKELIAAVGGALVIVIAIMVFAKDLLQKWFENIFTTVSQKSIVKFSNSLQRSTSAFEILLGKEFEFYEISSKYTSSLVIEIQDFYSYVTDEFNQGKNPEKAKETLIKITGKIPEYKNQSLIYQCFVSQTVSNASALLICELQKNLMPMFQYLKDSVSNPLTDEDKEKLESIKSLTLLNCAYLMSEIQKRLVELSKE